MNRIEKIIYDQVKSMPWLKYLIRNLYQAVFDLLPRQKEFSSAPIDYKEGYFFGFHDKTPFSVDGKKILANGLNNFDLKMPQKGNKLNIGYLNHNSGTLGDFVKVGESDAWNYHKGCRLQWLNNEELIFNTTIEEQLGSLIVNTIKKDRISINFPIDTVSDDGEWATSFSYERLEALMPGYGYRYNDNGFLNENAPKETGLFLINLKENKRKLLLSLRDLAKTSENSYNQIWDYRHYVTHSEFSADGKYISFLHRWTKSDTRDRITQLVIYDREEKYFFSLPTDGMVSHYVWNTNNQIIAYCRYKNIDSHVIFDIPTLENIRPVANVTINSDGHQSFINDKEFITDTYPDRYRMAKLFKVNVCNEEVNLLASLYSPQKYQTKDFKKHIACDLHPRVSPDGKFVCFDSVRTGKRSLNIMPIA